MVKRLDNLILKASMLLSALNILLMKSQIIVGFASDTENKAEVNEAAEKVQAVFMATSDKIRMYREFNLILIGLVAVMVIVAIVLRVYTDKEIITRRIMDRRYTGVTDKEQADEVLHTVSEEDTRDKELDKQKSEEDTDDEKEQSTKKIDLVHKTTKVIKMISNDKAAEVSASEDSSNSELNSSTEEQQVVINYVPKVKKDNTTTKDKEQVTMTKPKVAKTPKVAATGLDDGIESIKQAVLEAKQEVSQSSKQESKQTDRNNDTVTAVNIAKINPSDVIIEGEQLDLKPSEIDIDYVPKINEKLLEQEIGTTDSGQEEQDTVEGIPDTNNEIADDKDGTDTENIEANKGNEDDKQVEQEEQEQIENEQVGQEEQTAREAEETEEVEELDIWADEPTNEYEFLDQGMFVYRADRPRLHPTIIDINSQPSQRRQPQRKMFKRERKLEQKNAAMRAVKQAQFASKQSKEWSKQLKAKSKDGSEEKVTAEESIQQAELKDMTDEEKKAAELEKRYSEQDFG